MDARVEGIDVRCLRVTDGDGDVMAEGGELIANFTAERAGSSRLCKASDHM